MTINDPPSATVALACAPRAGSTTRPVTIGLLPALATHQQSPVARSIAEYEQNWPTASTAPSPYATPRHAL
eukprot:CAMPEP_0174728304 /NCGR_PEP_ID=MMETSP1094-20130205/51472_1 /TAXON_ID=156173 /ORGANISM="Chrysochromulina brevifilum, Strain UTEX LB 985" /LENGTH=70 /DNA_ID=CAMNT_0015930191 /DNA_START=55 /DNA_END=268 /DNA_ORIENTATION=-